MRLLLAESFGATGACGDCDLASGEDTLLTAAPDAAAPSGGVAGAR